MKRVLVLPILVAVIGGCGGEEGAAPPPPPAMGAPGPGGGLSVTEALLTNADGPLLVRGALVVMKSEARLCDALAESYPPQCGGPSLRVEGLDLGTMDGVQSASGVSWLENAAFLGDVDGETLRITPGAQ